MATLADVEAYQAKHGRRPYWLSLLIALDQLANAALWGYVDETLSSRCYRCRAKPRWAIARRIVDAAFFWDRAQAGDRVMRHCEMSYYAELLREHLPQRF
ncbi:hypothetical protein [Marinobacter sp.]|uniref:hypothetical protein n=1 Tax=Marinobacter sp. TaxID=50741 RepID=UPI003A8DC926